MPADDRKPAATTEWLIAATLILAGTAISALSVVEIRSNERHHQMAQANPPLQSTEPQKKDAPAESKPGGERPTTPAPEPARPDPEAQKTGAQPALPPAPAEKIAPPIKER